jgi:hypothetical protein
MADFAADLTLSGGVPQGAQQTQTPSDPTMSPYLQQILAQQQYMLTQTQQMPHMKEANQVSVPGSIGPQVQQAGQKGGKQNAAALINGLMQGMGKIYNKHQADKQAAVQSDLQRAMQLQGSNQQLGQLLQQLQQLPPAAQTPATKQQIMQIQQSLQSNQQNMNSIATGKNGKALQKILGGVGNPMEASDPAHAQMIQKSAGEVAQKQGLTQKLMQHFMHSQAKQGQAQPQGTMPVGGQPNAGGIGNLTNQRPQGINPQVQAQGGQPQGGQVPMSAQQPQGAPQLQNLAPSGQPQTPGAGALGGGAVQNFSDGMQVNPQAAPQKITAGQRLAQGLDQYTVYGVGRNTYRDEALKEYMELTKAGAIMKPKDIAELMEKHGHNTALEQHWGRQDIVNQNRIIQAGNIAEIAAKSRLSTAVIQANSHLAVERIRAENRLKVATIMRNNPKTEVAGLKLQASVLQSELGDGNQRLGSLDQSIAAQQKVIDGLTTTLGPKDVLRDLTTGPKKRAENAAHLKSAQDDLKKLQTEREQKHFQLVEIQNRLLNLGAQGAGDGGTGSGSTTINFNDSSPEAAGQDSTESFDKIFDALKGDSDGSSEGAEQE